MLKKQKSIRLCLLGWFLPLEKFNPLFFRSIYVEIAITIRKGDNLFINQFGVIQAFDPGIFFFDIIHGNGKMVDRCFGGSVSLYP